MSLSLSCLLGLSWLSGFLLYAEPIFFAYMFTITNGLQGVAILLFRCALNDEIRSAIVDRYKRRKNSRAVNESTVTKSRRIDIEKFLFILNSWVGRYRMPLIRPTLNAVAQNWRKIQA